MADIELLIKLDKKTYNSICECSYFGELLVSGVQKMGDAIKNATPLPKGHGRLKDADAICKDIISALGIPDENYLYEAEKAVYKRIKNASTIIEADKGE